jgi:hypothetical protein
MSEQPTYSYSTALVSYIDILGFGDLVNDSRSDPVTISTIVTLLTTMKEELAASGRHHRNRDGTKAKVFHSFNFSDLIVRSTLMPDRAEIGEVIEFELFYVGAKQFLLTTQGVLVRGGISVGDVLVTAGDGIVFGPALVKSYKLESEDAIYPRIILDRALMREAEQKGHVEQWRDYVRRGEDGAYFLDYLFGSFVDRYVFRDPGDPDPSTLIESHRNMIEAMLKRDIEQGHERIRQKYVWLALYHNSTMTRLQDRLKDMFQLSGEFDRLKIPESLLLS